jgi:hypothetical protein
VCNYSLTLSFIQLTPCYYVQLIIKKVIVVIYTFKYTHTHIHFHRYMRSNRMFAELIIIVNFFRLKCGREYRNIVQSTKAALLVALLRT